MSVLLQKSRRVLQITAIKNLPSCGCGSSGQAPAVVHFRLAFASGTGRTSPPPRTEKENERQPISRGLCASERRPFVSQLTRAFSSPVLPRRLRRLKRRLTPMPDELAEPNPPLATTPGAAQAAAPVGDNSGRRGPEHGLRAGAGAGGDDSRDTRPDRATRFVETTRGTLSYAELAPLLAERVAAAEAALYREA